MKLMEVARTTLQGEWAKKGLELLVRVVLVATRRTDGNPASLDLLILRDLKKILEDFPSMPCPPAGSPTLFPREDSKTKLLISPRWILRSLYKIRIQLGGPVPTHIRVLRDALESLQCIYVTSQNEAK